MTDQEQAAADIASAYVAKLTPEQFASFVAATREPGESTPPPVLGKLPEQRPEDAYPTGWAV
ncbi:hypothetical protein [Nocardia farcinica]|uniref:Uncharacterized protein n=1 Tax=Nocardia farcinica (strain IFM 10152) TaxID=247156 RepID=Q5Z3A1_NOCFA|nr:hypothetical protein [Nocardia farcinica]MBF6536861.1 hypothetical protein [Nocardia farcinica]BAD55090.1 hypothetical protein NFA_2480 [Nocardia farcinica IFM 10152]